MLRCDASRRPSQCQMILWFLGPFRQIQRFPKGETCTIVKIVQSWSHRLIWIGYWSSYGHFWHAESMSAYNGSWTLCWLWSWHTIVQQRYRPPVLHQMLFFKESVSTEGSHPYTIWSVQYWPHLLLLTKLYCDPLTDQLFLSSVGLG